MNDLEYFVSNEFKEITFVDEIPQFSDCKFTTEESKSNIPNQVEKLYSKLYEQKKKLQLLINSINGGNFHGDCEVKYYSNNGKVKQNIQHNIISETIQEYFKYFNEINCLEIKEEFQCTLCDTKIELNDNKCNVCGEPFKNVKAINKNQPVKQIFKRGDQSKMDHNDKLFNDRQGDKSLNTNEIKYNQCLHSMNDMSKSNAKYSNFTDHILDHQISLPVEETSFNFLNDKHVELEKQKFENDSQKLMDINNELFIDTQDEHTELVKKTPGNVYLNQMDCQVKPFNEKHKNQHKEYGSLNTNENPYNQSNISNNTYSNFNDPNIDHSSDEESFASVTSETFGVHSLEESIDKNKVTIENCHKSIDKQNDFQTMLKNMDQWMCKDCHLLNTYHFEKCGVCSKNRQEIGRWMCSECTFINDIQSRFCVACYSENMKLGKLEKKSYDLKTSKNEQKSTREIQSNQNLKDNGKQKNDITKSLPTKKQSKGKKTDKNINNEKWKCSNSKCGRFNDNDKKICSSCKCKQFIPENNDVADQMMNQNNNNFEKQNGWNCPQCTFLNKNGDSKCKVCFTCKPQLPNTGDGSWQCWNTNCKQNNDEPDKFCNICGLDRFADKEIGHIIKQKSKNGIRDVWICGWCNKFNDIAFSCSKICSGKNCHKDRFSVKGHHA